MQKASNDIIIFLLVVIGLILLMIGFILSIVFLYKKRQQVFEKNIEDIKQGYEKSILTAQLEIQEETFNHISREIHDNISPSLTLAKLNLRTINVAQEESLLLKVESSIELLSRSISELSDISRSLNSDIIAEHGLIKALQEELKRIRQAGLFTIQYQLEGNPIYLDRHKELIIFRIIQEAFNNIIKHSKANRTYINLRYDENELKVDVEDNGRGFVLENSKNKSQAGIRNMESRVRSLNGDLTIQSTLNQGTLISFTIPFSQNGGI